MFIKKLSLKNFRNYEKIDVEFTKTITILIGDNAQGKTSLIEGIYALSTTKSHRTSKANQMIRFEQDFAKAVAIVETLDDEMELGLVIAKKGKTAKYNGANVAKLTDFVGRLKTVFFAPEDLELIKGSPSGRRRFLDMDIGQIDNLYIHHLSVYSKLLKQRNELLKHYVESDMNHLQLEVLTSQLIEPLIYILNKRKWFLQELESHAKLVHHFITDGKEELSFEYINSTRVEEITEDSLLQKFETIYATDKRTRTTNVGVHRDDFAVFLSGMNAHEFASQGQQRTAILSMRLAEINLIYQETGIYPVLLLDDVLSELDESRQSKLLASTNNKTQTFITTTSVSGIYQEILDSADVFVINDAKIGDYYE